MLVAGGATPEAAADRPSVAFVGVRSPDLDPAARSPVNAAVAEALGRRAAVVPPGDLAARLLAVPDVHEARALATAADAAMAAFEFERARTSLDAAIARLDLSDAAIVAPEEFAGLLEKRARVGYALGRTEEVRATLGRLAAVDPTRALDAREFPPELLAEHASACRALREGSPSAPDATTLARIARRARVGWAVGGDVRLGANGLDVVLVMAADDGREATRMMRVPTREALAGTVGRGVDGLFADLGMPGPLAAVAVATPSATAPERRSRRWMLWAGGVLLLSGAAVAAAVPRSGGGASQPPPDDRVVVVFPDP